MQFRSSASGASRALAPAGGALTLHLQLFALLLLLPSPGAKHVIWSEANQALLKAERERYPNASMSLDFRCAPGRGAGCLCLWPGSKSRAAL